MFDPEDPEAIPSKADQAAPVSGFGLGVELGVVAGQGAGGLVALANLVAGVSSAGLQAGVEGGGEGSARPHWRARPTSPRARCMRWRRLGRSTGGSARPART